MSEAESMMVVCFEDPRKGYTRRLYTCGNNQKHYPWTSMDKKDDTEIPIYYSLLHAHDRGWRATKDIMFCPPEEEYVWLCPSCAKEYLKK